MEISKVINKIVFKDAKDLAQAQDIAIVKAFDLPAWVVKTPPKFFQWYAKLRGYTLKHSLYAVEFFIKDKKVAHLVMINGVKAGKFKKYERTPSKKN